jgi:hypothetical protein
MARRSIMIALVLASILSTPSALAGGLNWGTATRVERHKLIGITCPTARLCVAFDGVGNVAMSSAPFSAHPAWRLASVDRKSGLTGIACPSVALCVGYDASHQLVASRDPGAGKPAWRSFPIDPHNMISGLACPTAHLCVATDNSGNLLTATNPAGRAAAWTVQFLGDTAPTYECFHYGQDCPVTLDGLSCATASLCVALDQAGNVVGSNDPAGGASTWRVLLQANFGQSPIGYVGVTCPTASLCVAYDGYGGDILTSTNALARSPNWRTATPTGTQGVFGGSCASASLCIAEAGNGGAYLSTAPSSVSGWRSLPFLDTTPPASSAAAACFPPSVCLVADQRGNLYSSTTPATLGSWHHIRVPNPITDFTCTAGSDCVTVDTGGRAMTATKTPPTKHKSTAPNRRPFASGTG